MRNWIIVLLIFVMPLSLYAYLDAKAKTDTMCKVENGVEVGIARPKLIKFSSPMCSECQEAAVELKKAMKHYKDDIEVIEINVLDSNSNEGKYAKEAIKKYRISLVPTFVFLDKNGKVVKKREGTMLENEIIEIIDRIK